MKSIPALQEAKKILLVSANEELINIFNQLCESKEFVICQIVENLKILSTLEWHENFDILVADQNVQGEDSLAFIHANFKSKYQQIPILYIFNQQISASNFKLLHQIHAEILPDNQLELPVLNYLLHAVVEKKQTMQLLKENELRYQSLFDHSLDINLIVDENSTVVDANTQGRKQLSFSNAFPLLKIFQRKKDYNEFISLLSEVEQVSRFETLLRIGEKEVICLLDAFTIYNVELEKSGAHVVIRNIDASKRMQSLKHQASKLMVTGKFLRSLAHEIRNPLTNVNLALDQMNQEFSENKESKLYLDILQRSTNRISDLLNEIMKAYKNSELELSTNSLHNIIENAARFANDRFMLKNIDLQLKLHAKNDAILADKVKLTTAFLNLLVNASEAIDHDHGQVVVETSKKENQLYVLIKDNGCGMNEVQTKALFDPFYTGKSKGLGLGLTTAQNVIFAHKGSISVNSKENKGTSFTITLPPKA